MKPPFPANQKARGDRSPGALYAIDGGHGWIYYCQLGSADGWLGCFRYRTRELATPVDVLSQPIMSQLAFVTSSIGDALRGGHWLKMGRHQVHSDLTEEPPYVIWSAGKLTVTVMHGGTALYKTRVDDPRIQDMEIASVWFHQHLRDRLVADYGAEPAAWHIGGPIWRERLVKEERARRFPHQPWNQLPPDWVPVQRRTN